jgi:hypothetical protein
VPNNSGHVPNKAGRMPNSCGSAPRAADPPPCSATTAADVVVPHHVRRERRTFDVDLRKARQNRWCGASDRMPIERYHSRDV